MTEQPVYASEDQALSRIAQLQAHGFWPGMRRLPGGFVRLTHDPDITAARYRAPAPDTGPGAIAVSGANLICPPSDQPEQGGKSDLPPESTGGTN